MLSKELKDILKEIANKGELIKVCALMALAGKDFENSINNIFNEFEELSAQIENLKQYIIKFL